MRSFWFFSRPLSSCLAVGLVLIALMLVSPIASAQWGVSLLDDESFIGWTYGEKGTAGWTIEKGCLSGSAKSAPLLSGYSAGDFELRFDWSIEADSAIELRFPEVPNGAGLTLTLCESDGCGRLTDGDKQIEGGKKIEACDGDAPHKTAIKRDGNRLSLSIDGNQIYEAKLSGAADRRFGLGIAVTKGKATIADLRAIEPSGESLIVGENLDGWACRQNLGAWKVENGELCLTPGGGSYIQTSKLYSNFTLSCEVLIKKGGNSGFGIRTMPKGWPSGDGMEVQILDNPKLNKSSYMAIYGNMPPIAIGHESEKYNTVVIKADGWMISAWIGGRLIQHVNTKDHPELRHRNLKGWIGFQDHGAWIRVRNLKVLESPEGEGLDAWYEKRNPSATAAIIDRMMNIEQASIDHGIRTNSIVVKTKKKDTEVVLADLTGPGAITRIANIGNKGRLAFYFDGEGKPQIECKPADVRNRLPRVGDSESPVPLCLPYARSLKIVLCEGGEASYGIDYVTFPKELEISSYGSGLDVFPRGWLDSSIYRTLKFRFGCAREHDPLERVDLRQQKIEPGQTLEMVKVDGAGVAEWTRFYLNSKLLEDESLWLEVTVDGEKSPAVSVPLRKWLAGIAISSNYSNLMWTNQNNSGKQNMMAMPFSEGIHFSLVNQGESAVEGLGIMAGIRRVSKEEAQLRGRLRTVSVNDDKAIEITGRGRLVGLLGQELPESLTFDADDQKTTVDTDLWLGNKNPFRASFSGLTDSGLYWRWLIGEPVDFDKRFHLEANGAEESSSRTALFYMFD